MRVSLKQRLPLPRRGRDRHGKGIARTETFPAGLASVGLGTVGRQILADEPPPLPPNNELLAGGCKRPKPDGRVRTVAFPARARQN
jgi:hypothetical protein